jgi:hypothetical protein
MPTRKVARLERRCQREITEVNGDSAEEALTSPRRWSEPPYVGCYEYAEDPLRSCRRPASRLPPLTGKAIGYPFPVTIISDKKYSEFACQIRPNMLYFQGYCSEVKELNESLSPLRRRRMGDAGVL